MNIFRKIWNNIKECDSDPCKDPRCKGCAHIDGLICPYPKECSAMLESPILLRLKEFEDWLFSSECDCRIHAIRDKFEELRLRQED